MTEVFLLDFRGEAPDLTQARGHGLGDGEPPQGVPDDFLVLGFRFPKRGVLVPEAA